MLERLQITIVALIAALAWQIFGDANLAAAPPEMTAERWVEPAPSAAALPLVQDAAPAVARAPSSAPLASVVADVRAEAFARAGNLFNARRYAAAYASYLTLADAGHVPSARIALAMYQNGLPVFGSDWDATPEQLAHWQVLTDQSAATELAALR